MKITRKEREILVGVVGRESREFELHERRALKSSGDYTAIVHSRRRICFSHYSPASFFLFFRIFSFPLELCESVIAVGRRRRRRKNLKKKKSRKAFKGGRKNCWMLCDEGSWESPARHPHPHPIPGKRNNIVYNLLAGWLAGFGEAEGRKKREADSPPRAD